MRRNKFKQYEAIVFDPKWKPNRKLFWDPESLRTIEGDDWGSHPLRPGNLVYFLGAIPNVPGHCIVGTYDGRIVPMVHPEDFRKAKESEL